MWRRLMPRLAGKHRVVAIDLRGFGWSDKPIDSHYSTDDHANVVRHVLQEIGIKKGTLIGHSFGGAVALVLAARELGSSSFKVSRLVLMDSPAFPQRASAGVAFLRAPLLSYVGLNLIPPQKLAYSLLRRSNGDRSFLSRQDLHAYAEPFRYHGARHALIQTGRQIEPRNFGAIVKAYSRMDQPALLVWCRKDRVVPLAIGVRLQKELPNAKLRIIDTCSHVPIEQAPEQTTRIIEEFLSKTN
jgi:pimeloyl-ACP methyl ester carboxylesterase